MVNDINSFSNFICNNFLKQILDDLDPNQKYWKGKSWKETIKFRSDNTLLDYNDKASVDKVLHWGGIYRFKDYSNVSSAFKELENKNFSVSTLERISSYSKLFSFYDSSKYFILDARVAFSLNCFLLSYSQSAEKLPYSLIDFKFKSKSRNKFIKSKSELFGSFPKNKSIPYHEYNDLVLHLYNHPICQKTLSKDYLLELNTPEIIEMIIFKYVEEIFKTCSIE
jgi:hypothetical protein